MSFTNSLHEPSVAIFDVLLLTVAVALVAGTASFAQTPDKIEALIEVARNSREAKVRQAAIVELGTIKDGRVVEPLIRALSDRDRWVRAVAVDSLQKVGDERAVEPLVARMRDQELRVSIVKALGSIAGPRVVDPLIGMLPEYDYRREGKVSRISYEDLDVRREILLALGATRDMRAIDALIQSLDDNFEYDPQMRRRHAGPSDDERSLLYWRHSDREHPAVLALVKMGADAVESLIGALRHTNDEIRRRSVEALATIRDARATGPLIATLDDEDDSVRNRAAVYLAELTSDPIVAARFDRALTDSSISLRADLVAAGHKYFIVKGRPDSTPALLDALQISGYRSMAENFLNSGEPQLENAAKEWAAARKYRIFPSSSHAGPRWGGRR